jgi:hypothetical protein
VKAIRYLSLAWLTLSIIGSCARAQSTNSVRSKRSSVIVGEGLLERSVLLHDTGLGPVTDMILNPTRDAKLGVAGLSGAVFLKADHSVLSRVTFRHATQAGVMALFNAPLLPTHVQFVDIDGHQHWEFLNRGGVGWSDGSLIDKDGRTRWIYGGRPGLDDMTAGDLNGDGVPEFVAGFNGDGGLRRLDKNGKLQWQKPDANVWHVEIVDTDGDGKPEIVHTSANGQFTIRDSNGTVIRSFGAVRYCSHFSLCRWPSQKSSPKLLVIDEAYLVVVDFLGGSAGTYQVPHGLHSGKATGMVLRLKQGEQEFFGVVATGVGIFLPTSTLMLFAPDHRLVYQETLPGSCTSILAVPADEPSRDDLLVGGTNTVWKYSLAKHVGSKTPGT